MTAEPRQYAMQNDVPLTRNLTMLRLNIELRDADVLRIIIWTIQEIHGTKQRMIDDIAEVTGVVAAIRYFNRKRDDWANLPWPSECRIEGLKYQLT